MGTLREPQPPLLQQRVFWCVGFDVEIYIYKMYHLNDF